MLYEDHPHLEHCYISFNYLIDLEHLMFRFQITERNLRRQCLRNFANKMKSNILEPYRIIRRQMVKEKNVLIFISEFS